MSSNQKNNYPLEFKISSAQLAVESKQSVAKTARDLGVNHNTLHGWIEKYSDSNQVNQKNMNSDKATCFEENKRLKKELYQFPSLINFLGEIFLRIKFRRKAACT